VVWGWDCTVRVVFIHLNGPDNISGRQMHSIVDHAGFDVKSIFFRDEFVEHDAPPTAVEMKLFMKMVAHLKPSIICMGVNSMRFYDACPITIALKERFDVPVVWGGVHPTLEPERCLQYADYVCRGEGDEAIVEFLNKFSKGESLRAVKNFWFYDNGELIKNELRPLISDLDTIPFPDFTEKNKWFIVGEKIYKKDPVKMHQFHHSLSTSRGCPFQCAYCMNHKMKGIYGCNTYKRRSVDNVIQELCLAKKIYPKLEYIAFFDDVFLVNKLWLEEFRDKFKREINLPFYCFGYVSLTTDAMAKIAVDAGLQEIGLGIQSGSEEIRKLYDRFETDEQVLKCAEILNKYPVTVRYSIITSEFEDKDQSRKGLEMFFSLPKPFSIGINKMAYYSTFKITRMALDAKKITQDRVVTYTGNKRVGQALEVNEMKDYRYAPYYYLLGWWFYPNWLVRYMFENNYEERHLWFLILLGKVGKMARYWDSIKWIWMLIRHGEFVHLFGRLKKALLG